MLGFRLNLRIRKHNPRSALDAGCLFCCHFTTTLPTLHAPPSLARLTYTGGYLLPGTPPPDPPVAACQGLPDGLENACIEQVAWWFINREHLGLKTFWPSGAAYQLFATQDLLDSVKTTLSHYRRFSI
jgi:hypothetical protein